MKSYIEDKKSIKSFSQKDFCKYSLSPRDYRVLKLKNSNFIILRDLMSKKERVGKEIGSESYMKKSEYRFLKTANITKNFLLDDSVIEYCKPDNKVFPTFGDILISKDGGGDGLGEVAFYNYENKNNLDSISSGILSITIKEKIRYYVLGILKSRYFKNFLDLNTAQGSTIRHSKKSSLDCNIPFPTEINHAQPESIIKYISLLVKNIIDKEERINEKNLQIDKKIEIELNKNQKDNKFIFNYPNISDIKSETRLDTGLYSLDYQSYEFLIKNYENNYYNLDKENIYPGVTPKDYHYSNIRKNKDFHEWVTPKNINRRQLCYHTYIYTKSKSRVKSNSLVLNGIRYVGNGIFVENNNEDVFTNQNTLIINQFEEKEKQLFLFCFLTSRIGKKMQLIRRNFGIVPILYTEHLCKIPIPKFPKNKRQNISELYYNQINPNENMDLENYLNMELKRNKIAGIFQLNIEIFNLKEKLEKIIDQIVTGEKIKLNL